MYQDEDDVAHRVMNRMTKERDLIRIHVEVITPWFNIAKMLL